MTAYLRKSKPSLVQKSLGMCRSNVPEPKPLINFTLSDVVRRNQDILGQLARNWTILEL